MWSIDRGFARFKTDYMAALAGADMHRQGDIDGRGNLSQNGLDRFCEFFFSICLDRIAFMDNMLNLEALLSESIDDGLLISDTPKGPVRLHFSAGLLPFWFPALGPE